MTTVIDLESFACVDALARTLRFHVAAKSCALSPAAFSKRVRQAEEQLGVTLFARTTRRVSVTPDGERVLPRVRALLEDAARLRDAGSAPPVDITLGTRHELGLSWLMPARAAIQKALPRVTVHLRFGGTDELEDALARLRIDGAVLSRLPATRRVHAVEICREDYVMVASRGLLRTRPLRDPKDAGAHVLVDADDTLPLFRYARAGKGAPVFARTLTLGTIAAIRDAVRSGEGVAVLPHYFVADDLAKKRLVRVLPSLAIGHDWFRLLCRADDARRPILEEIARVLRGLPLHA